jgi:hypothetical protein
MAVFNCIRPGYKLVNEKLEWNVQVPYLQTTDGTGLWLDSPFFPYQENPDSQWRLYISDTNTQIFIWIYQYDSAGVDFKIDKPVLMKMSIINEKGRKVFQQVSPSNPAISYIQFMLPKEEIIKSECQQVDGSLTFCRKIISDVKIVPVSSADPSILPIDCRDGLMVHLEELFDKMPFSDGQL